MKSGNSMKKAEDFVEAIHSSHFLSDDDELLKVCRKNPGRKKTHDWVLGHLRPQVSVWVCKFCSAIRIVDIPFAVRDDDD